jgi:Ca-activated chloride channel family protein
VTLAPIVLVAAASGRLPQDRPTFSATSELVVLHVTVTTKKGLYVAGLRQDSFRIFEEGQPQTIRLFTSEDAPVTVGLLIDSSGSMQGNRDLVAAAAAAFVQSSNPSDEVFALTFNDFVRSVLPESAPFTSDPAALRGALFNTMSTRGRTALYDAIVGGVDYFSRGRYERKVLIVVSDGGDNASHLSFDPVLARIEASNVVIYAVGLIDPLEEDANPKRLKQLAQASGGQAYFPRDARQVADVLQRIARDIRSAYTMGYVPADRPSGAAFRRIRVVASVPRGQSVVVRTRAGYLSGTHDAAGQSHVR